GAVPHGRVRVAGQPGGFRRAGEVQHHAVEPVVEARPDGRREQVAAGAGPPDARDDDVRCGEPGQDVAGAGRGGLLGHRRRSDGGDRRGGSGGGGGGGGGRRLRRGGSRGGGARRTGGGGCARRRLARRCRRTRRVVVRPGGLLHHRRTGRLVLADVDRQQQPVLAQQVEGPAVGQDLEPEVLC